MKLKMMTIFIGIFLLGFLFSSSMLFYFIFTQQGSKTLARFFLKHTLDIQEIHFGEMTGSMGSGFKLKNLEIENVEKLPQGSIVRIQEIELTNPIWDVEQGTLVIRNGRLILPSSEPIVLDGKYALNQLDFKLYTKSISLHQIKEIFDIQGLPFSISGNIDYVDLKISGTSEEPILTGKLFIEHINYQDFALTKSPVILDLKFKKNNNKYTPTGQIILESGKLIVKNLKINIEKSTFFIKGDFSNPTFLLKGNSAVENTDIHVVVGGTKNKPDIKLSSDSGESSEKLLLMLATGKSWKGLDSSLEKKHVTSGLVSDLIDYFVFAGSGEKLSSQLGVKSISLNLEEDKKGLGVKKQVMDHLDVGYEISENTATSQQKTKQQKVSGDVKFSDNISLSLEKEIRSKEQQLLNESPEDNKFILKYKSKF